MKWRHCRGLMKCVLLNFQKIKKNQNIINELMTKVQELQYDIKCQDSRLKKRQCVHSCTQLVIYLGRT